jgi:hypothetical protein
MIAWQNFAHRFCSSTEGVGSAWALRATDIATTTTSDGAIMTLIGIAESRYDQIQQSAQPT